MASLRQQWRGLSLHERYQVAMFVALVGVPAVALFVCLVVIVVGTFMGFVTWGW